MPLEEWFPLQRQPGVEYFRTALQEDFLRTYHERGRFTAQRVISLENSVNVLRAEFWQYIDYLPGLRDLIGRSSSYVSSWVLEFYATVWIYPDHTGIAFSFLGERHDISSAQAREILRIPTAPTGFTAFAFQMQGHPDMLTQVSFLQLRPCVLASEVILERVPADCRMT